MSLDELPLYPICVTYNIFIIKLIWTPKNYFEVQRVLNLFFNWSFMLANCYILVTQTFHLVLTYIYFRILKYLSNLKCTYIYDI